MAHFNTGGGSHMEGGVHPKLVSHSTSSPLLAKLAALEKSRSGGALTTTKSPAPKPVFQKKCETAAREDVGTSFPKPQSFKLRPVETIRDTASSGPESTFTRPPLKRCPVNTAFLDNEVQPAPASGSAKPPWVKDSESENTPTVPKLPIALKSKISISSLQSNLDQGTLKEHPTPSIPKLPQLSIFKSLPPVAQQNSLTRQGSETSLQTLNSSNCMPPQPPPTLEPNFLTAQAGARDELVPHEENDDPSAPKRKPLPNVFSLGDPPLKPNRPPHVTLQRFRTDGPELSTAGPPPSPLAPHTSKFPAPLTPCLLSKAPAVRIQADQEESYDDVGVMNLPAPLPPGGHPNLKIEVELSDEEMYEDLEERWIEKEAKGSKEMKGQEKKSDKEEKRRLEQEKKMQKAREKKEQEAKKKYKLSGPIQVIHKAKARSDCKGGKTDLPLTQGETIDIIRITDNPEGRWLARNNEGNYGYVRTESVGIDYDLIKEQKKEPLSNESEGNPEVYDDVAIQDNACSGIKVQQAEDGDIYDDVDGSTQNRFPPQPTPVFIEGDMIYDDVESQSIPTPPLLNSLPQLTPKGTQEVMDPKKKKKFEKEEKEIRKKFKLSGPIQVIHKAKARSDCKGGKTDLPLTQGETIDIIRITDNPEGRWLARNNEGNYGYVRTESVGIDYDLIKEQRRKNPYLTSLRETLSGIKVQQAEDGDIYDDVDGSTQNRFPPQPPPVFIEGDMIYDDVESQSIPTPPLLNSLPQLTPKGTQEVMDPKKKKKFEKEEKEFRKKFKFEGEIQVLYDVTIDPTLASKKWGNKDLQLKPGEVIDVIVKPTDGKLIGRNRDGKFGYVSMVNVAQDGGDIYDDIGENCIYDND
ncbi:hypothetical protein J4Q44_G00230480 [Coregonus suidteri]|uniref:SH3 domain-containing protein n=1 Tax=Coregonus suidteri TaxID=861788 RepID=A0AAN8QPV7_9TELE